MTLVSLIAVVDQNGGLGKDNQLLCRLPADLAHFKAITMGKPILMGRHTFDSIGKPLPGRRNIVLSRQPLTMPGVEVMSSLQFALQAIGDAEELMVIGGAQVYQEAFNMASRIYLTRIDHAFDPDVFFPKIQDSDWRCVSEVERSADEKNPYLLCFCQYERINQGVV